MSHSNHINFNEFYTKHYRKTYLFAKSYVHDHEAAEDIATEALISFWKILKKNEIHHPLTFLFAIIKNKSIDYLRHKLIHEETLTTMSDIGKRELIERINTLKACEPEKMYSREVKEILENALHSLPDKTRQIFVLSRFENLSKKEIASTLHMTIKGVEYHLSKALNLLKIAFKDYLPIFYFLFFYH